MPEFFWMSFYLHELYDDIIIIHCRYAVLSFMYGYIIGEKRTTHNVHLISRLVDCVQSWGPLWAYTCFVFETMNGELKKTFMGLETCQTRYAIVRS